MTHARCPVCLGETIEIRAKLVCRRCGQILETCCEGGPMGTAPECPRQAAPPAPPAPTDETRRG